MRCHTSVSLAFGLCLVLLAGLPTPADAATEAEILALESSGELLPPPALVQEIESDLALIRRQYPFVRELGITVFPFWVPGELLLEVDEVTAAAVAAGEPSALDPLNEIYGPVQEMRVITGEVVHLDLGPPWHPELLAPIYAELAEVEYAEPNHFIGDGPDITRVGERLYDFRYAWGDCPAGCIQEHVWRIRVDPPSASIEDQWGDPVSGTSAPAASVLAGQARAVPNPFNPRTELRFELRDRVDVVLELFDQRGRLLRRQQVGVRGLGPQAVTVDAVDAQGRPLASGSYFVVLRLNGERVQTVRLALIR